MRVQFLLGFDCVYTAAKGQQCKFIIQNVKVCFRKIEAKSLIKIPDFNRGGNVEYNWVVVRRQSNVLEVKTRVDA